MSVLLALKLSKRLVCVPKATAFFRSMGSEPRPTVFITRAIDSKCKALLLEADFDVQCWESDEPPPRKEFLAAVKGKDALFCVIPDGINKELLDAAGPNLKVVSTMSVGYDHVDVKECKARNIKVGYTPGVLTNATAELTVGLLLATCRRFKEGMHAVENGEWGTWKPFWMCGSGLDQSTVGIVGLGRIGSTVAQCLKPFGVKEFLHWGGSDKKKVAEEIGARYVKFDELLERSDFVITCCAFNDETKDLFDISAFKRMKKSAVFVNVSRGGVVQQDDLYEALKTGEIAAAGLDVTTPEPLPTSSPLLQLSNCVILPHMGSATTLSRQSMAFLAAKNIVAAIKGEDMPSQL